MKKKKRNLQRAAASRPNPQPADAPSLRHCHLICLAAIALAAILVYANSFNGEFLWDDRFLVQENLFIRDWGHVERIFTSDIGAGAGSRYSAYRPLQILSYALDFSLYELDPRGFHVTNTLIHLFTAWALYWFGFLFLRNVWQAGAAALLFAVHPVHTEAVAYISGRADPLAGLFVLLAFVGYLKHRKLNQSRWIALSCIAFAGALLSRENAIIFPVLLLLYERTHDRSINLKRIGPPFAILIAYAVFRVFAQQPQSPASGVALLDRIPSFLSAFFSYLRLLFVPTGLHMEYGFRSFPFSHWSVLAGFALLAGLCVLIAKLRRPDLRFTLGWYGLALLPVSNIFPINAYMAEHWLYLPSMGAFLSLAILGRALWEKRGLWMRAAQTAGIAVLLFFFVQTIRQNATWKDPITFFRYTLKYAPGNGRLWTSLGLAEFEQGQTERAVRSLEKAVAVDPGYAEAQNHLGYIYDLRNNGNERKAIGLYRRAIELDPAYVDAYNNLGAAYFETGRFEEAIAAFREAIRRNSNFAKGYANLAIVYFNMEDRENSRACFEKAKSMGLSIPFLARQFQ